MRRPQEGEYGAFYKGYIDLTRGADFLQNLEDSADMLLDFLENLPHEKRTYSYAEGKWSIHQMLQHIVDCDTVFTYRALWMARGGNPTLEGFDENLWAANSADTLIPWSELIEQFKNLRNYAISLFHSFSEKMLEREAHIGGFNTRLRSIPFIMAGHTFHHLNMLKSRYL